MPLPYFLSIVALIVVGLFAFHGRTRAWGLPALAVVGTASVWYIGDAIYNDYEVYVVQIGPASIVSAWWQFFWFVVAFGLLVKPVHMLVNGSLPNSRSHIMLFVQKDVIGHSGFQHRIDVACKGLFVVWSVLMGIGLWQVNFDVLGLFAPYLGHKANPWARSQIGGGFSFLISLASYFQIFLCSAFGVLAALAKTPKTRNLALIVFALSFPYYLVDRTRNTILSTSLPGLLAYVFIRLRSGIWLKAAILVGVLFALNAWFLFVMENRTNRSIASAMASSDDDVEVNEKTHHEGLNMFEELAWIEHFSRSGLYQPNWGRRYFAELVNPIPRGLWKNKPTIGLDYAVARGQSVMGEKGEVTATISTGMVGQGVVNFGPFLGPMASAFLMSLWVALVARQDLLGSNPARLMLYALGLILTFNLGRDITFLVAYPFLFGWGIIWFWEYQAKLKKKASPRGRKKRRGHSQARITPSSPTSHHLRP